MKRLTILVVLLLAGCAESKEQTPEEMVAAAKVCRDGGLRASVMENLWTGERHVTCGPPAEDKP